MFDDVFMPPTEAGFVILPLRPLQPPLVLNTKLPLAYPKLWLNVLEESWFRGKDSNSRYLILPSLVMVDIIHERRQGQRQGAMLWLRTNQRCSLSTLLGMEDLGDGDEDQNTFRMQMSLTGCGYKRKG